MTNQSGTAKNYSRACNHLDQALRLLNAVPCHYAPNRCLDKGPLSKLDPDQCCLGCAAWLYTSLAQMSARRMATLER